MKNTCLLILFILSSHFLIAQGNESKTILFLIPFQTDKLAEQNRLPIRSCDDIYNIESFNLVGFWEGAKLALDEYENKGTHLKIIVRDISDNAADLYKIFNNDSLMKEVDLIIGPFFINMFSIAAEFANYYEIPIVNPFSRNQDFVNNNNWVYKLIPSSSSFPAIIHKLLLSQYPHNNVILWADTAVESKEYNIYKDYFLQHNIPFQTVTISQKENITTALKANAHNIIIASFESEIQIIQQLQLLAHQDNNRSISLVIPEDWINMQNIEPQYFNLVNAHFFSHYYVDYLNEKTLFFISNFIEHYGSPPDLKRFSFQGYDITRYFVEMLLHNFDASKIDFSPISLDFEFQSIENGGFENIKPRLIKIENFEFIEVK